jgi:hypothetical protein
VRTWGRAHDGRNFSAPVLTRTIGLSMDSGCIGGGGRINGAQRNSMAETQDLTPGKVYRISLDLHLASWVFPMGRTNSAGPSARPADTRSV